MADVKISNLGAISAVAGEDLVAIVDDPSGTPASRKATIDQIKTYIGGMTATSTATFEGKTFDVEGTGNSISNIDVADLKSGVLDTDLSSVSGSDDTLPSAKAVKTYVDAQIDTEDTISELNDTTIGTLAGGQVLIYDGTDSWDNKALSGDIAITSAGLTTIQAGAVDIGMLSATGSSITTKFLRGDNTWQTVTTSPALSDLSDVTPGSATGDILYKSSGDWISLVKPGSPSGQVLTFSSGATIPSWTAPSGGGNHTEQGFDVYTSHTGTATTSDGVAQMFARRIDANNDGLFIMLWKNGQSQEVQIA